MPGGVISSSLRPFASVLPNLAVLDGDLAGSAYAFTGIGGSSRNGTGRTSGG